MSLSALSSLRGANFGRKRHLSCSANQLNIFSHHHEKGFLLSLRSCFVWGFFYYSPSSLLTSFNKWDQISSASIAALSILWCLPVEAAKTRYRHVNVLFGPSIFPYCACPASKDSISCAHTRSHSAHLGKHSSREVINQFYGFLWESFLLSNQPPPPPHTTTTTSTIFPSVSVFGSHLRTIHSSQLTSSTPPPPNCIPPRDNWSKLGSGISAPTIPDKTSATGLPTCPQFVRQLQ